MKILFVYPRFERHADSNPELAEGGIIRHHDGILGGDDLLPEVHDWDGPVALVTITRVNSPPLIDSSYAEPTSPPPSFVRADRALGSRPGLSFFGLRRSDPAHLTRAWPGIGVDRIPSPSGNEHGSDSYCFGVTSSPLRRPITEPFIRLS